VLIIMKQSTSKIIENLLPNLKKKEDEEWTLWEHKTLNTHRAVLLWQPKFSKISYPELAAIIRQKISDNYKRSWWRGFAFGVIIDVQTMPDQVDLINDYIDIRDNKKGTWQWSILVCQDKKTIIATHTWIAGFLTPLYQTILENYSSKNYDLQQHSGNTHRPSG